MEFLINKHYILRTNTDGKYLTYSCVILNVDEDSVKIRDKYGKILSINKKFVSTAEEVDDGNS